MATAWGVLRVGRKVSERVKIFAMVPSGRGGGSGGSSGCASRLFGVSRGACADT